LAIFLIAASIAMGAVSIVTPVSANIEDKQNGRDNGLDPHADDNVHDNTGGLGGDVDKRFHEGLCQGGLSTDDLEAAFPGEGCDALHGPGGKNP
jgi:hypothetical protein